jgi:hypothetical protein
LRKRGVLMRRMMRSFILELGRGRERGGVEEEGRRNWSCVMFSWK